MQTFNSESPFIVAGIQLRTTNERAFEDIPAHWKSFYENASMAGMAGKASEGIYAIYTDFEREGVDNAGVYSFIIGVKVIHAPVLHGIVAVNVPASRRAVFEVQRGHPEKVVDVWHEIWRTDTLQKTFVCDYERYQPDGTISIHVGVH